MTDVVSAIQSGDINLLNDSLNKPGRCVNDPIQKGRTALHVAIQRNMKEMAEKLIQRGADVNLPDSQDCTPLMIAINKDNPNMVRWLIGMGAETDGKSPDDEPYDECTENMAILDMLKTNRVKRS